MLGEEVGIVITCIPKRSNHFRFDLCQHVILISLCRNEPETRAKSYVECHDDIHDFNEDNHRNYP